MKKRNSLGEKICELRKQKGLSQEALGNIIGVSRQAISKWELDEMIPGWESIGQLSKYFGVGLGYFTNELDDVSNEIATVKNVSINHFKRWLILSIIGGIVLLILATITVCMGIIILTSNTGDQIVQTSKMDRWELIVLIVLCIIMLIVETIFIVMTVKRRKFQQ